MKIGRRLCATATAAVLFAAGLIMVAATPATASCTTFDYFIKSDQWSTIEFEGPSYSTTPEHEWYEWQDIRFRGTGGSRPDGWTPIEQYKSPTGPWTSILEGYPDTHDFFRSSDLDFFTCV